MIRRHTISNFIRKRYISFDYSDYMYDELLVPFLIVVLAVFLTLFFSTVRLPEFSVQYIIFAQSLDLIRYCINNAESQLPLIASNCSIMSTTARIYVERILTI